MQYLQWLSMLFGLVETYATARTTPGVTVAQANMATLSAANDIIAHVAAHPLAAPAPAATPLPVIATAPVDPASAV